jgi:hypothetical protein
VNRHRSPSLAPDVVIIRSVDAKDICSRIQIGVTRLPPSEV